MTLPLATREQLRESLPIFKVLPPSILDTLDYSEFVIPGDEVAVCQEQLEQQLQCYIVTYRANMSQYVPAASRKFLCSYLVPAKLNEHGLAEIVAAEQACERHGVVFVAYAKPLQIVE